MSRRAKTKKVDPFWAIIIQIWIWWNFDLKIIQLVGEIFIKTGGIDWEKYEQPVPEAILIKKDILHSEWVECSTFLYLFSKYDKRRDFFIILIITVDLYDYQQLIKLYQYIFVFPSLALIPDSIRSTKVLLLFHNFRMNSKYKQNSYIYRVFWYIFWTIQSINIYLFYFVRFYIYTHINARNW